MSHFRRHCLAALVLTSALIAQPPASPGSRVPLELFWDGGLRAESTDGRFKLRLRARFENDWGFLDSGHAVDQRVGPLTDGTEMRRVRLGLQGQIYDNIPFKAQIEFASGVAEFRNVYAGVIGVPVLGNLRIGNQREPMGLERNTGTHNLTFMERANANALNPKRNTGILAHDSHHDDRLTWAFGLFRETNEQGFGQGDDGIAATARLTGVPWRADESHFLHLGLSLSRREFGSAGAQLKARPGLHLAPFFVNTTTIAVDHGELIGVEALWAAGPTSIQAEHFEARLGDRFQASYILVSHFLTGERRRLRGSFPQLLRIKPIAETGAWELAGRVSRIDLNNGAIRGGKLTDYTLGLNWYANPNVRIMANLIYAELDRTGDSLLFGLRFGIDF